MINQKLINDISFDIIGCAIEVHKKLGPGLLKSVYKKCLRHLLFQNGMKVDVQQIVPVNFIGLEMGCNLRCDLLVENLIIVEQKTVENIIPIHEAQPHTYLKLSEKPKGILINFNFVNIFKEGLRAFATKQFKELPKGY